MPSYPQLGIGNDSSDMGFGLNMTGRFSGSSGSTTNQTQSTTAGLASNTASSAVNGNNEAPSSLEFFQRLNAMLENSIDLNNLAGDMAPNMAKRPSYPGPDTPLSMSELFGFGNGNYGSPMVSQQDQDVLTFLQQHQALQQQLGQQQLQQLQMKYGSSMFLNKNEGQPKMSGQPQPRGSIVRQSMSSGIGDSPISSGSSPASSQRASRSHSTQSTNGFLNSMQPGTHSTPTSCRAIRKGSLFSRESSSPTLEQVLMGCQRDGQGNSTESDFSMLSSSGLSSAESSLAELMQSLNMSGTGSSANSSVNPFANLSSQQLAYQQHQSLQNSKLQASLQALQQNGLAQLGNLTGNDMSPQGLQTLSTNIQNLHEVSNHLQNQNLRYLQSLQAITGNGLNANGLSSLLNASPGIAERLSPLAALSAVESALQSSWTPTSLSAAALGLNSSPYAPTNGNGDSNSNLERAARMYRNAAALCDATFTWSGHLPARTYKNATYSCKVFLGGVPWDITEASLTSAFKQFGSIKVEWPGKENVSNPPKGYVYIIFDNEKHVKSLLQACTHDFSSGGSWYYKISSRRMRSKEVQVIPWMLSDSNYVRSPTQRLDPQKTVFVGALHGMLNAEGLAHIMNDLFGGVLYAGIDTDKFKYPIGSGRVTFNNTRSYMKAVAAAFIEIKTPKFTKKVQVDPYLEDSICAHCTVQQGPYFCRDLACFKYYCRSCWQWQHSSDVLKHHRPLMRHYKGTGSVATAGSIPNASSPISHSQPCDLPQPPMMENV